MEGGDGDGGIGTPHARGQQVVLRRYVLVGGYYICLVSWSCYALHLPEGMEGSRWGVRDVLVVFTSEENGR